MLAGKRQIRKIDEKVHIITKKKKITPKWWGDWFVTFKMTEAEKHIDFFPIHQ